MIDENWINEAKKLAKLITKNCPIKKVHIFDNTVVVRSKNIDLPSIQRSLNLTVEDKILIKFNFKYEQGSFVFDNIYSWYKVKIADLEKIVSMVNMLIINKKVAINEHWLSNKYFEKHTWTNKDIILSLNELCKRIDDSFKTYESILNDGEIKSLGKMIVDKTEEIEKHKNKLELMYLEHQKMNDLMHKSIKKKYSLLKDF